MVIVTASLRVEFVRPTPLGVPLEVRGTIEEITARKVVVRATVSAEGQVCARGDVVAVDASAWEGLVRDAALHAALARRAFDGVRQHYTVEQSVSRLLAAYASAGA